MISSEEFFKKLQSQFKQELPFVAYRKAGNAENSSVKALLQRDSKVYKVKSFLESGFVLAPFDEHLKTVLIPQGQSQIITSSLTEKSMKIEDFSGNVIEKKDCKEQHISLVEKGIKAIEAGKLKKVVLSRTEEITFEKDLKKSALQIFQNLLNSYDDAFIYIWYHPNVALWIGATPETLVNIKHNHFETMALAGTKKAGNPENIDWSDKEKDEQKLVTDTVFEELQDLDFVSEIQKSDTYTSKAGNLMHLRTDIKGKMEFFETEEDSGSEEQKTSNLQKLIKTLHPTPAVCGLPKEEAKKFILENEGYRREYYTGFLGELNLKQETSRNKNTGNQENSAYKSISKSTALYVNLRCMKLEGKKAQLFIGGGITAGSNPEDEWEETTNKTETMKKVLFD